MAPTPRTNRARTRAQAVRPRHSRGQEPAARPFTAAAIVQRLSQTALTQREIGHATAVSDRTVRTWRVRTNPSAALRERLDALVDVDDMLSASLTARGVAQWLRARNRGLDGRRPLDALAADDPWTRSLPATSTPCEPPRTHSTRAATSNPPRWRRPTPKARAAPARRALHCRSGSWWRPSARRCREVTAPARMASGLSGAPGDAATWWPRAWQQRRGGAPQGS